MSGIRPWTTTEVSQWASVPLPLVELVAKGAAKFGYPMGLVRGECRASDLVRCRRWISLEARKRGYSYPLIGRALNRDHTTIMSATGARRRG